MTPDTPPPAPREPYAQPRLVVFGSMRELTLRAGGTKGKNDGGGGVDKTSF